MPGAIILADQPTGAGSGSAGIARNDLWLTKVVDLSCTTSGNSSFVWTMLSRPPTSIATLTTPTASTSSFTPDVVGTYRIRLVTNGGGVGNEQTLVYRARYDSTGALENRGWAYPALGEIDIEANYGGNLRGWAEDLEFILEDVRVNYVPGSISALTGDVTATGPGSVAATVSSNVITNAKLAQVPTATFKGRLTSGTGNVEDLTASQATSILDTFTGDSGSGGAKGLVTAPATGDATKFLRGDATWATVTAISALTGDVTASGSGSVAATIAANAVTNAKLAQVATATFKGRTTAGTGDVEDLTASQATALLDTFTGDSGSGGTKGLVVAPTTGDATKFLRGDATWSTAAPSQGYGISVTGTSVALKTAEASLTDAATVSVDADNGPNLVLTATGAVGATRQLGNPSNSDVGKTLRVRFVQDATGGRALTFAGNWVNAGFTTTVAQLPNAVSFIEAENRNSLWYYVIKHAQMANLDFVDVSGSKTLALSDANTVQRTTSASAINITVPAEASVNFAIGTVIEIMQDAAGQVTVVPTSGNVVSRNNEFKTAGQNASIFLKKKGANSWQLTGDKTT